MADRLDGCRVAILVTDGFEEVELTRPRQAFDDAGAESSIGSPTDGTVRSWRFTDWGQDFPVDVPLTDAGPGGASLNQLRPKPYPTARPRLTRLPQGPSTLPVKEVVPLR